MTPPRYVPAAGTPEDAFLAGIYDARHDTVMEWVSRLPADRVAVLLADLAAAHGFALLRLEADVTPRRRARKPTLGLIRGGRYAGRSAP
jgi:hypothetical protein